MAIRSYVNKAAYNAATKSTIESQVSMIETSREIIVDGVNVVTTEPVVGDVLFLDENNQKVFVKGAPWLQKAIIPTAWTHVGYVFYREGRNVSIINKDAEDQIILDVRQYAITAIADTTLAITLRMGNNSNTVVDVTLTSATIDATSAAEISAAVAAKATAIGDTTAWWAYLADANGQKVDSGGTRVIIQCDTNTCNNFDEVSAVGCTVEHASWEDMPMSLYYLKTDGGWTEYRGVMNRAVARAYLTNNGSIPTQMIQPVTTGNDAPVRPSCFEDPTATGYEYCELLRQTYGTYDDYLKNGWSVMIPQKLGTFSLPDGREMARRYAMSTAPTKDGGTKFKFPAFYDCHEVNYESAGLGKGNWWLPDPEEGCRLMVDETLAAIAPSISIMGTTAINNTVIRFFSSRYSGRGFRAFYSTYGILYSTYFSARFARRVQAVTLLQI